MAKRMRYCFCCNEQLGELDSFDYDDLDTCGNPACEREATIERRELAQEERDWDCGGDYR